MNGKKTLTILLTLIISLTMFANNSNFVRYPALNNNGSQLAFSFQGDIWSVSTNGGKATRLTIHEAYEGWPFWSNDDNSIAFSSNRYGNYDVFLMPKDGGFPKRLTYHSANDVITDFTSDDNLIFSTNRLFQQIEWDSELSRVSINGGTPNRVLDAVGNMATQSPNGKYIAFARGWGRVEREKYKGSADFEIWLFNTESKQFTQITNNEVQDIYPRWANDNTLYFVSARSGKYNIHKVGIDANGNATKEVSQITNFNDNGTRYFNISKDGSTLAMEVGTDIYTMKIGSGNPQKVEIKIDSDYRFDPIVSKSFSGELTEYSISPNCKYTAKIVRGEIFISENDKEKSLTFNLTNNPYRDQNVTWLNDSTLIFTSDRDGQYDLYSLVSSDKKESNIFKSMKHKINLLTKSDEDESNPIVSPDSKKIVYQIGRGKLVSADISNDGELSNKTVLLDGWATPEGISWSPDSKWIAYSLSDLEFNDEIFIHPVDNSIKPVNVSMHPRGDYSPVWSRDGSKLGFVSQRSNSDIDIWFAWLKKSDWDKTKADWETEEEPKSSKKKKGSDSTEVKPIRIDVNKIHERLQRVTSLNGDETNLLFSKDGKTIYFTAKSLTNMGTDIFSINFDGTDIKEITKSGKSHNALFLDKDAKYIYFVTKGKLSRIDIKSGKEEALPFNGKMEINFAEEQNQIFEESWRALRDGFYDPNFHNNNWDKLKDKYKPMCLKASTQKDFQDMYNIMLGELNASHMGMRYANDPTELQKEKTGLLGVEVSSAKNGVKVLHVVPNSPADREQSKLLVGDVITNVNGTKIDNETNFYSLLTNTVDDKVLLNINRSGDEIEIIIRPTSNLRDLLYNDWVENNRKLVDKWSNGKIGYLHIEAMGMESFERFEREFTAVGSGKDAIVIDVRFNGGGWTTDYLMTILNYKQHAYTIPRGAAKNLEKEKKNFREFYPTGERLPYAAWMKPSIAICNQNSYSNAEIFSHAYKNLGIGTLVGVPTFGAVISTGSKSLIDGSTVRMPSRGWFVKTDDNNMDLVAAVPDIIVENAPDAKATGNDAQLKRAVEELLKQIK